MEVEEWEGEEVEHGVRLDETVWFGLMEEYIEAVIEGLGVFEIDALDDSETDWEGIGDREVECEGVPVREVLPLRETVKVAVTQGVPVFVRVGDRLCVGQ